MANSIINEKEDSGQAFESEIDAVAFKKDIDSFAWRVDIHDKSKSSRMTEELSLEGEATPSEVLVYNRGAQLLGDKPREADLTTMGEGTSTYDSFSRVTASQFEMWLNPTKYSSGYSSQTQPEEIQGRCKVSWEP